MKRLPFLLGALLLPALTFAQPSVPEIHPNVRELMEEKMRDAKRLLEASNEATPEDLGAEGAELLVSGDAAPESEVHAAMNPLDSNNIIAAPMRQDGVSLTCPIYYTRDFGKTWRKSTWTNGLLNSTHRTVGGGDPVLAFDAEGRAYFTWIALFVNSTLDSVYWGIYWASSTDGGETWAREVDDRVAYIETQAQLPFPYSILSLAEIYDKQWLAIDRTNSPYRGRMYAPLVMISPMSGVQQMRVYRKPAGAPFDKDFAIVSDSRLARVQFSSVDIDPLGGVHVSYFGVTSAGVPGLWHVRSTDGGETFSQPVQISTMHAPRFSADAQRDSITGVQLSRIYPSPHLVIDRSNGPNSGTIYCSWSADGVSSRGSDGLDIYFTRSTDGGLTWAEPIVVNDDERGVERNQFHPCIGISPSGIVTVAWYDRRTTTGDRETSFLMAHSFDGGRTFSPNRPLTTRMTDFSTVGRRNGGFGVGEYNAVVSTDNYVIPFWADGRTGDGDLDIYTAVVPLDVSSAVQSISTLTENIVLHEPRVGAEDVEFRFALAARSRVKLTVVDLQGKIVATLADGVKEAGESRVSFSAGSLSSGTHVVQLESDHGTASRLFLVAR